MSLFNFSNVIHNSSSEQGAIDFEALQKARKDLVGEIQAIIEYDDHIESSNNSLARLTWQSIRDEELVHVGELLALIGYLAPYQVALVQKGIDEFNERKN